MTLHDPYEGLADRYDLFYGGLGQYSADMVEFYRSLLEQHHVRQVLDCACGTGRHLPLFQTLGCEVTGSDLSASMLAQARKNLAGLGLQVPLHRVDYRELPQHFAIEFGAVLCLSSSILHMPDEAGVLCAFESMRAVLRRGGLLILTQGTTDRQWQEKPRFLLAVNDRVFTRLVAIDYFGPGARYNIVDIHHSDEMQGLQVWSIEYPRIYLRDDYEQLLAAAGFNSVDFYGSYRFEPYDRQSSQQLIVVAHR